MMKILTDYAVYTINYLSLPVSPKYIVIIDNNCLERNVVQCKLVYRKRFLIGNVPYFFNISVQQPILT